MKIIFNLISRSSDYNISQLDSSTKRCMCRKGFRLLDPDINKEQFRCIRNVDPGLNQDHISNSELVHPSASPQNFKVQVLQGKLLFINYTTDISKERFSFPQHYDLTYRVYFKSSSLRSRAGLYGNTAFKM